MASSCSCCVFVLGDASYDVDDSDEGLRVVGLVDGLQVRGREVYGFESCFQFVCDLCSLESVLGMFWAPKAPRVFGAEQSSPRRASRRGKSPLMRMWPSGVRARSLPWCVFLSGVAVGVGGWCESRPRSVGDGGVPKSPKVLMLDSILL